VSETDKLSRESRQTLFIMGAFFVATALVPSAAMAYNSPAAGSFGYTIYDLLIKKIAQGAVGTTVGIGAMLYAAVNTLAPNIPKVIGGLAAGGLFLKGEELAVSLGAIF
jgi:hypothetical protein